MFQTPFLDECFAKVVWSLKILMAESGPSLRMRNLVSAYEEADVRQRAKFSTAAKVSKEPILTSAAYCTSDQYGVRAINLQQLHIF
jgi:hypothetical protein